MKHENFSAQVKQWMLVGMSECHQLRRSRDFTLCKRWESHSHLHGDPQSLIFVRAENLVVATSLFDLLWQSINGLCSSEAQSRMFTASLIVVDTRIKISRSMVSEEDFDCESLKDSNAQDAMFGGISN